MLMGWALMGPGQQQKPNPNTAKSKTLETHHQTQPLNPYASLTHSLSHSQFLWSSSFPDQVTRSRAFVFFPSILFQKWLRWLSETLVPSASSSSLLTPPKSTTPAVGGRYFLSPIRSPEMTEFPATLRFGDPWPPSPERKFPIHWLAKWVFSDSM